MMNLGSETVRALDKMGYTDEDIDWIGTREFRIPLTEFFDVAYNTDYNNSYGSAKIPCDLIIKMKDGAWYSRGEYDGSEWWQYNEVPDKPMPCLHLKVKNFLEPNYDWDPTLAEACGIRR